MNLFLTDLQSRLCDALQNGLPICSKPFARIAESLNCTEDDVLRETNLLKSQGVIRRIGAKINYRALGKTSTLVAAHVPKEILPEVTQAVNSLETVSHNYLRQHHYNLWFTLQADSEQQIEAILANLSARFGIRFLNLPTVRVFKLDVRFYADNTGQSLQKKVAEKQHMGKVELNSSQKAILAKLQGEMPIVSEPFKSLTAESHDNEDTLSIVTDLMNKGVIRRIAAVVDQYRLGIITNVLFVSTVSPQRIDEAGKRLAAFPMVSHCYERRVCEDWPYNLFAMMHARSIADIQKTVDKFTCAEAIDSYELLPTAAELKKQPVKHRFE